MKRMLDPRWPAGLRRLRAAAKWRQDDLAKHSRVDQGTISRLERGQIKRPSWPTLTALAHSLNTRYRRLGLRQRVRPEEIIAERVVHVD